MSSVLQAVHLGKRIGRKTVFHDVDIEIDSGTLIRISGGNGSGKSTLLRVLAGAAAPTIGHVRSTTTSKALVPERFVGPEGFTPPDYLKHMGRVRGLDLASTIRQIDELVEVLGLRAYERTRLGDLSKGNAQKVAVAQAFLTPPAGLLFLDEPNTGLDDRAATTLNRLVQEALDRGCAVVLCEHELSRTLQPKETYRLEQATLRLVEDRSSQDGFATISVSRQRSSAHRRVDVNGFGVIESVADEPIVMRVSRADVDKALQAVLTSGWSVLEVRADDPQPREVST